MTSMTLAKALAAGDPDALAELIAKGADVRYTREHGYTALIDAVHGREVSRDPRLLDLLRLLVDSGANLNGISSYGESGLRVLSRIGRFDGVRLLLDAGVDREQLEWTPLMDAVALGTVDDVSLQIAGGADLEARDFWQRTPWLIALLTGDVRKAQLLFDRGANPDAVGRCAQPALFYAIDSRRPEIVRWLLDLGADVNQSDEFGLTALMHAAQEGVPECLDALIDAGADLDRDVNGTALNRARLRPIVERLLAAGANPAHLSDEGRRAVLGLPPEPDATLMTASAEEFRRAPTRRFGRANPELMNEPFWLAAIRSGLSAFRAGELLASSLTCPRDPIWSAQRYGQTLTILADGRIVLIAGEHEDFYDADFCIYNDVFVQTPDGTIDIYGYPRELFPPTDFHTATLVDDAIYVIGALGYQGARRYGHTPVFRLDTTTWRIDPVATTGEPPGWIYKHRTDRSGSRELRVHDGTVLFEREGREVQDVMREAFVLDLDRLTWRRE